MDGQVDASHLAAEANGRQIVWENPLSIQFSSHESADGLVLDQAQCVSDYLSVDASGSLDDLKATAEFDIGKLATQLQQFSDLHGLRLQGQAKAQLECKREAQERFAASGQLRASGFRCIKPDGRTWNEDKLFLQFVAEGQLRQNLVQRIEKAQLTMDADSERMEAQLTQPVDEPLKSAWPLACSWSGELGHWAPRLESFLGVQGWDVEGVGTMEVSLRASPQKLDIQQAKADFTQFQARGHGWYVSNPR